MEAQRTTSQLLTQTPATPPAVAQETAPTQEKGAIGIAFLVWLFGGGLGLAILIFILLKVF